MAVETRPFDRDARLARARAEGRQAHGIGPAVALQYASGAVAVVIGGLNTLDTFDHLLYSSFYGDDLWIALAAVAFLAVGAGQWFAARTLSKRLVLSRRGKAGDGALANACVGAAVAAGLHLLFPIGVVVMTVLGPPGNVGPPLWEQIAELGVCMSPFALLPMAALIQTIRAWKAVVGDHSEDAVDLTIPASERHRQRIVRDRRDAVVRPGVLMAATGALCMLIGGMAAAKPPGTGPYPGAFAAVLIGLGGNGLGLSALGLLLMAAPATRVNHGHRLWNLALGSAVACAAIVFLAVLFPNLGGAAVRGPITNIGHVGRTGCWIILAEIVPGVVLAAILRSRRRVRELRAEAGD